jgi:hypothetical protein
VHARIFVLQSGAATPIGKSYVVVIIYVFRIGTIAAL